MLSPPFLSGSGLSGECDRVRTLLVRAFGIGLIAFVTPRLVTSATWIIYQVFVAFDGSLRYPGPAGYLELLMLRFADVDWLNPRAGVEQWAGLVIGLCCVLRRYRGPRWGKGDE